MKRNYPNSLYISQCRIQRGIYRQHWAPEGLYGAARRISACGFTRLPRKHGNYRIYAAKLGNRAQHRLLRSSRMSFCRLYLLVSRFGPLVLTNHPPKSMAIFVGF